MSAPAPAPSPEAFGPAEFQALANVSRETLARLKAFVALLTDWNARHNLVSARSLDDVWRRHVWDSAQLLPLIPKDARSLVDLGSGAGFPGLILAVLLKERPGFRTVLYEATAKKCKFLAAGAERLGVEVDIRNTRIESAAPEPFDLVTARACASLDRLLLYAQPFLGRRTKCLFLRGQSVAVELTGTRKSWRMKVTEHRSRSDPSGVILEIRDIRHVA